MQKFGHEWDDKLTIGGLSKYTSQIGKFDEDNIEEHFKDLVNLAGKVAARVKGYRDFLEKYKDDEKIKQLIEDLDSEFEGGVLNYLGNPDDVGSDDPVDALDEVRGSLDTLFNIFDYYRVLVK